MAAATISTNGHGSSTGELRAAAYRASLAAGAPLSGGALGRQFEMSERWGRDRVTEVQRDQNPTGGNNRAPSREAGTTTRDEPPENWEPNPTSDQGPAEPSAVVASADPVPQAVPQAAEGTSSSRRRAGRGWTRRSS